MKRYRNFVLKLVSLAIVLAAIAGYNQFFQEKNQIDAMAEEEYEEQLAQLEARRAALDGDAAAPSYQDGTYEGEAQGYGGLIHVKVTVKDGRIDAVDIVSAEKEDAAYFDQAVAVIDEMLVKQTSMVDTVSGATFSSTGIINAVTLALEEAE